MAKITEEIRKKVMEMYEDGITNKQFIADEVGIHRRSVGRIIEQELQKEYGDLLNEEEPDTNTESPYNFEGLLPCPYCGGNPKIRAEHHPGNHPVYDMMYHIECTECHMRTCVVHTGLHNYWHGKANYNVSSIEAINAITDAWNRRFEARKDG